MAIFSKDSENWYYDLTNEVEASNWSSVTYSNFYGGFAAISDKSTNTSYQIMIRITDK